jgi:HEAT repeat protein
MGLFEPNIEKMRTANDIRGLIKALGKSDDICDEIRIAGMVEDTLEDIGHRTTEPFIEALSDNDATVRSGAAWILGNIKDPNTVGPLIEALKDYDKDVRWLAVTALEDIGDERAIEPIRIVPTDDDDFLKEMVTEALEKIKSKHQEIKG